MGILQLEGESIDEYLCPKCDSSSNFNLPNMSKLDSTDYEMVKKLLKQILVSDFVLLLFFFCEWLLGTNSAFFVIHFKANRNSWPFKDPVDKNDVPNYYVVVKEPMGKYNRWST